MRKVIILLAITIMTAACSRPPEPETSLDRVLQPEMIGATLQYLEALTGPPLKLSPDGRLRTYKLGLCEIQAAVAGGRYKSVDALRVILVPECEADIGKLLPSGEEGNKLLLSQMTFGKFQEAVGGKSLVYANCLSGCGNAFDPLVYAYWIDSRDGDLLEIMIEVGLVENDAIAAGQRWRDGMSAGEGETWVEDQGFNCAPEKYNELASKAFSEIRPKAFTIGRGLALPRCTMPQAHATPAASAI